MSYFRKESCNPCNLEKEDNTQKQVKLEIGSPGLSQTSLTSQIDPIDDSNHDSVEDQPVEEEYSITRD